MPESRVAQIHTEVVTSFSTNVSAIAYVSVELVTSLPSNALEARTVEYSTDPGFSPNPA